MPETLIKENKQWTTTDLVLAGLIGFGIGLIIAGLFGCGV
jgi:hypothetical protein